MMIRVIYEDDGSYVGTTELPDSPAVGDTFWHETQGPFRVLSRTWHGPTGFQSDRPEPLTIAVERVPHK